VLIPFDNDGKEEEEVEEVEGYNYIVLDIDADML
jgi:hypothetical protein